LPRSLDSARITLLAEGALKAGPQTQYLAGGHELLDRAESTLSEQVRQMEADTALPPPTEVPTDETPPQEDLSLLVKLTERLSGIPAEAPVQKLVLGGGFGPASYRLSLLSLLGNEEAQAEGPVADLTQMPYDLQLEDHQITVMEDEISHISAGNVVFREHTHKQGKA